MTRVRGYQLYVEVYSDGIVEGTRHPAIELTTEKGDVELVIEDPIDHLIEFVDKLKERLVELKDRLARE